ncbi:hypothetical protein RLOC_00008183 [Lonchura striata]
MSLAG